MGRAMFTIIAAMAELESSLISERVTAGMKAAAARGKRLGRPPVPPGVVKEIRTLAASTTLSIREIHRRIGKRASRGRVGEITKQVPRTPLRQHAGRRSLRIRGAENLCRLMYLCADRPIIQQFYDFTLNRVQWAFSALDTKSTSWRFWLDRLSIDKEMKRE